jgi:hypothetical protein
LGQFEISGSSLKVNNSNDRQNAFNGDACPGDDLAPLRLSQPDARSGR